MIRQKMVMGMQMGNWKVLSKVDKNTYKAVCSCGFIKETISDKELYRKLELGKKDQATYCAKCLPRPPADQTKRKGYLPANTPVLTPGGRNALISKTIFGTTARLYKEV